jgi:heme-degrading monooxygenase HmoA
MLVTIFRSRLRPEHTEEYGRLAGEIGALARQMPGLISFKTFTAPDGERVTLAEFATEEAHNAWRDHVEHRKAQRLGRERFYAEFRIQVCSVQRQFGFPADSTPPTAG